MENQHYHEHGNHEDDEAFVACLVACGSNVHRMVFNVSIQLDLFNIIHKSSDGAHVSSFEIASQLPTRDAEQAARLLDSMLQLLVSQSFLTCSTTEHASATELRYGIAPKGKFLVADEAGVSLAQFYALTALQESANWSTALKDAVLEGGTLFGNAQHYFGDLALKPDYSQTFNDAMASLATLAMKQILKVYNGFEGLHTLVDVGGGNGSTLNMIISKYTSISGVNFDLPEVIRTAPTFAGLEHVAGNMFDGVPKGDAIILKSVLHNWSDEQCARLLNNCYEALPKQGKVILIEDNLPEIPGTDVHSQLVTTINVLMLSMNGRERSLGEYKAMAMEAGFAEFKVVCRAHGLWVMELVK